MYGLTGSRHEYSHGIKKLVGHKHNNFKIIIAIEFKNNLLSFDNIKHLVDACLISRF